MCVVCVCVCVLCVCVCVLCVCVCVCVYTSELPLDRSVGLETRDVSLGRIRLSSASSCIVCHSMYWNRFKKNGKINYLGPKNN